MFAVADLGLSSWGAGAVIATVLAGHGLRKRSLSMSGAISAWVVGALSIGSLPRSGVAMIAFYATGSAFTKIGSKRKRELDADYETSAQRSAEQVFACSALATGLAVGHAVLLGSAQDGPVFGSGDSMHAALLMGIASHYAVCAGDTWASELGTLARDWPLLITTLKRVPPGTNGGVSFLGLVASAAGGAFIGVTMWVSGALLGTSPLSSTEWRLVPFCTGFGLAGSLLDSLLGATLQETLFDTEKNKIVSARDGRSGVKAVCGRDVLSNMQVNIVSVAAMTLLGCVIGEYL